MRPAFPCLLAFVLFLFAPLQTAAKEVRPEDYGAVVDDGQDDSAAIQSALNDILKVGGGTVRFPDGKLNVRSTVNIAPANYVGADIKFEGTPGSVIEISTGPGGVAFSGGNLNTWTIEDLTFTGRNVPVDNPQFFDAGYVIFSSIVGQTNIVRCRFFGLAVPNNYSVIYFGNTDGKIIDSQFDGSLGQYPDGAVVKAENSRGLTVLRSTFIDYANFAGVYLSKSPAFTGSWIYVKGAPPYNANGQRRTVIEDSRFDEAAAVAVRIEDTTWATIRGINVNVNNTSPGKGVYLKNVEHVIIEQSWFGFAGASHPALSTVNVGTLEVNSLRFSGGVYFLAKEGSGSVEVQHCPQCQTGGQQPQVSISPAPVNSSSGSTTNVPRSGRISLSVPDIIKSKP